MKAFYVYTSFIMLITPIEANASMMAVPNNVNQTPIRCELVQKNKQDQNSQPTPQIADCYEALMWCGQYCDVFSPEEILLQIMCQRNCIEGMVCMQ